MILVNKKVYKMKIYNNLIELIGNTPLVMINKMNKGYAKIAVKVEYFNPAGSIKDRTALSMIEEAEKQGKIKSGESVIIEPTSGNTGIGLALVCLIKGYRLILTMPDSMSKERRDILKAYGAELVLTSGDKGMQGAVDEAERLNSKIKNSYIPQQFNNPANTKIHYDITAEEIWNDTDGKVDIVVAGVGTGGTISGIAKKLKEKNPEIKAYAVEPASSPVITKGQAGPHLIQGIGANFIPDNYNSQYIDDVITDGVKQNLLLKKYIDENYDDLLDEYKVKYIKTITLDTESAALSIIDQVKNGSDFDTLMSANSGSDNGMVTTDSSSIDKNIIDKLDKFKKDGIYNKVIKTSDSKYAVVYVYNTDKTNLESEIKENLTSLSDISTKMETHYLRKYNFDVYEEALKDEIEETNEDYFG